ncbi:hypothetical protein LZ32DRAFT_602630, partial [Colletotrichum eremochloae]
MTSKTQDKEQQAWGRGQGGWWSFGLVCLGRGWTVLLFIGKMAMQGTLHRRRQYRI